MRTCLQIAAVTAVAAAAVTGCSASPAAPAARPGSTPPGAPAAAPVTAPRLTAAQVARAVAAAIPHARHITVLTAATDPNHLLGRPGGYLSKAQWRDNRVSDPGGSGVDLGGSAEVYATAAGAAARAAYIQRVLAAAPVLGAEYDYLSGPVLLRLSGRLTPAQARGYAAALARLTGRPPRLAS